MTLDAVLWVVFAASAALSVVVGMILAYHWIKFAMHPFAATVAIVAYSVVSIALLIIMATLISF